MNALYESILKTTKEIKTKIMTQLAEDFILPMGGIPQKTSEELEVLASIEGLVISALAGRGIQLNNEDVEGYVNIMLGGNVYRTHRSKFPVKAGSYNTASTKTLESSKNIETEVQIIENSELNKNEVEIESTFNELYEDAVVIEEEMESSVLVTNEVSTDIESQNTEEEVIIVEESENTVPEDVEVVIEEENIPEEDDLDNEKYGTFELEEDDTEDFAPVGATIIGGPAVLPPVNALSGEIFVEEKRKHANHFVFDLHRITVCHIGSRAEDMEIMIAPLKIQKYSCPSVPIIVSVYYKGKMYFASSYDNNAEGRNTVQLEINEYYLLFRGSFNDKGEFLSTINTTGISSNQGDILTQVGLKKRRPIGPEVKNGHLKLRYQGEDGPGILEVFPIDLYGDDYAIMTRCGEFTDYYAKSNHGYGMSRIVLYDDGIKSEVVCNWDGEYLEADIVPV